MTFPALKEFILALERIGELKRITRPVDPALEITEIATRAFHEEKPALLFENVIGSRFPLAINVYGTEKRIELALGRHPEEIGEDLVSFAERIFTPTLSSLWSERKMMKRIVRSKPKYVRSGISQEVVDTNPDLSELPIQVCWPKDGGKFITQGQVFTYDPETHNRNVGMYRMQVFDEKSTGMHWQIQRGGGFHYHKAEELNQNLEVAVALGTAPSLFFATISALPEGIDELLFAAIIQESKIEITKGKTISVEVPAKAEFVLEGIVEPNERRLEGPFGDHFGHYSLVAPFPVFHLKAITHRKNPIYPATVVGIPPMEDKYVGEASQYLIAPLVRILFHEVKNIWAYYETGFNILLVASVDVRYKKEALKTAFGILGMGQLSLTKCLILVSKEVDPKNWRAVLREVHDNFQPQNDFLILPNVPIDTLDFTSATMELAEHFVLDATRKSYREPNARQEQTPNVDEFIRSLDRRILDVRVFENSLVVVKVSRDGREILKSLISHPEIQSFPMLAVVSDDIDLDSNENVIWGIFTRFDCSRDIMFSDQEFLGTVPCYRGVLGIDATWKEGYPEPLKMDEAIVRRVDDYWDDLWKTS